MTARLCLPPPLSQGQVEQILERWMVGGAAGGRFAEVARRPNEEPGWLLWSCRVGQLVARCPWHKAPPKVAPWPGPAVEVSAYMHGVLVFEENALAARSRAAWQAVETLSAACRGKGQHAAQRSLETARVALAVCSSDQDAIVEGWGALDALKRSREYRRGIEYLAQELAIVRASDDRAAAAITYFLDEA
jgi:hypothetical protein